MLKKIISMVSGLAVASSLVLISSSAASADALDGAEDSPQSSGMYAVDIDESVANAHGFEVVANADGSRMSVPVSPEAIALYEQLGLRPEDRKVYPDSAERLQTNPPVEPTGIQLRSRTDVKTGWCGSSFITADKGGGNVLYVTTGFNVILPTTAGVWHVLGTALLAGGMNKIWTVGATGGAWERSDDSIAFGPGVVGVTPDSSVTLANGDICHSQAPSVPFD